MRDLEPALKLLSEQDPTHTEVRDMLLEDALTHAHCVIYAVFGEGGSVGDMLFS